jgi:glycosyltransferase involved in cell wall biosynthesis
MMSDQKKLSVSVVIPARNEAKNLCHFLPSIPPDVKEIVLVDGHSTDDTIAVARALRPDIRIIRQIGRGKGDAMRIGFAACTQDVIVMLDGDGSADPMEIPRFVEALEKGYDFAKGTRFRKGGGSSDITPLRRLGNWGLCALVNILFSERFSDLCYGYNAFRRTCLDRIELDCTGFEVEAQLCLRIHNAKCTIIEVPSMEHQRIHGQSNLHTFKDGWRILKVIFSERFNQRSQKKITESDYIAHIPAYDEAEPVFSTPEEVRL